MYGNNKFLFEQQEPKKNRVYERGFISTDFNTYNQRGDMTEDGRLKFKRLIRKFGLTNYSMTLVGEDVSERFRWSNDDESLILVTTNHPITGKYYNDDWERERETGYLDCVGITCKSLELLEEFVEAFRSYASNIEDEY
jgi:hypothetical protein